MYKYLYDLILTSRKNACKDLALEAMPMLLSDAKNGVREYTGEATDLAALHADYEALVKADRELLAFLGSNYEVLMGAFERGDREAFEGEIAALLAKAEKAKTDEA